jgi:hypothetical protein
LRLFIVYFLIILCHETAGSAGMGKTKDSPILTGKQAQALKAVSFDIGQF